MNEQAPSKEKSPMQELREIVESQAAGRQFLPVDMALLRRVVSAHEPPAEHPDPYKRCQHDLLKPGTTIEVIDAWKAKCVVCIEFFDLPGRPSQPPPDVRSMRVLLEDAERIVSDFARNNPRWKDTTGLTQDPWGAHAWLERYSGLTKEVKP